MGEVANLMMDFIMEADCMESKVFVPRLYEQEDYYYPPSNIDVFYEELWNNITRKLQYPDIEDLIQDLVLDCLVNSKVFATYKDAEFFVIRGIFNDIKNAKQSLRGKMTVNLENQPEDSVYLDDICDVCGEFREIVFVRENREKKKDNPYDTSLIGHCNECYHTHFVDIIMKAIKRKGRH